MQRKTINSYRQIVTNFLSEVLNSSPDNELIEQLLRVVISSDFVLDQLQRYPETFLSLLNSKDLNNGYEAGVLATSLMRLTEKVDSIASMEKALRDFRRREMIRLIWRDALDLADIEETMRDTAWLAETCLSVAVGWAQPQLEQRYGQPCSLQGEPQKLQVIAMGKLGGGELNLSSDIDYILCYPESGQTNNPNDSIENQWFFVKLAKQLSLLLNRVTQDGFVFRVDMRLRPFGDSGPLVMNHIALRNYFATSARQWERYAFVKAKVLCGEPQANEALLTLCQSFAYQQTADEQIIKVLKEIKVKICQQVMRHSSERNIKLGEGGIREAEFIVQAFQLIYGDKDFDLRHQNFLQVLSALQLKQYIAPLVAEQLQDAYLLLRRVENRLQAVNDQQEHRLPQQVDLRERLAYGLHYANWDDLNMTLEQARSFISKQFAKVVNQSLEEISLSKAETIRNIHYKKKLALQEATETWREQSQTLAKPAAYEQWRPFLTSLEKEVLKYSHADQVIDRVLALLSVLLEQFADQYEVLERQIGKLVKVCSASEWLAEELTQRPELVMELLLAEKFGLPENLILMQVLLQKRLLNDLGEKDQATFVTLLNAFKYEYTMRIAVADVLGYLSVMRVSDLLTDLAIALLRQGLRWVWDEFIAEYGLPKRSDGKLCEFDFIIVAYGKLGGIELSYTSDLDLVFLHGADEDELTNGKESITGGQFYQRLGKRLVELLSMQTVNGRLYKIDTQLKPMGKGGMLVNSFARYANYQRDNAWTWEHQALVRARAIAGDEKLMGSFSQLRHEILNKPRNIAELTKDVVMMRERMMAEKIIDPQLFHLKDDPGGITDIEFMAQFVVLAWSQHQALLLMFPDNIRIFETAESAGLLARRTADLLCEAYRIYRKAMHHLALEGKSAVVSKGTFLSLRQQVCEVWRVLLGEDR